MLRRLPIMLFAAWVACALATPAQAAGPIFPPGSRVGLEPAGDLTLSHRFPGFEDADRHVIVSILDLPAAAYDQITRAAFAAAQQGLTNIKREGFLFTGGMAYLVTAQAQENSTPVYRYFMVASPAPTGVPNLAMLVRVEVPDAARAVYSDAVVRKMLATVAFREVPVNELLGMLPFKLTDLAGFHVSKVVANGVVVSQNPNEGAAGQSYAIITIGTGAPLEPENRFRFARDLLETSPVRELKVTSAEAIRIGGQPGQEIRAQALDPKGQPISLVQWVRFGTGGFLRIIAVSPKDDWDKTFERFRTLRDGIVLR
jgi:hypothetical protein